MQAARWVVGDGVIEIAGAVTDDAVRAVPVGTLDGASTAAPPVGAAIEAASGRSETECAEDALVDAVRTALEQAEAAGRTALAWRLPAAAWPMLSGARQAEIVLGAVAAFLAPGARLERVVLAAVDMATHAALVSELGRHAAPASAAIDVQVLCFAVTREIVGTDRLTLSLPARCTAGTALDALCGRHPDLGAVRGTLRLAVNQEYAAPETELTAGDVLALIPPVCGG
jgi:molybdopterin converting factor subunit 1